MSERWLSSRTDKFVLAGAALVCVVNIGLFIYFLAVLAMVEVGSLSTMAVILCSLSIGVVGGLIFDRKFRSRFLDYAKGGAMLLLWALLSFWLWNDIFEDRKESARLRLDVSELCDRDVPKTDESKAMCRQFVVKHGGYICALNETPMTRCEKALRNVAGRSDAR